MSHLQSLRALMREHHIDACIVPGTDPHASEYMAPHWMEMNWLSGFKGETGTVVVTMDRALLWTDSRYYLQAEAELAGTTVELMRESDVDCPTVPQWLMADRTDACRPYTVAVNPEMYSVNAYEALRSELAAGGLSLRSVDLVSPIWTEDRPPIPMNRLLPYDEQYAGESVASKIDRVRRVMEEHRCDALVVSALDEIGWLLNIRGTDVDYTPCVIAYAVVEMNRCTLFVAPDKMDEAATAYMSRMGVEVRGYEGVFDYLHHMQAHAVLFDGNRLNQALYEQFAVERRQNINLSPSPVQVMMSVKNEVELAGTRRAMHADAVALTRFFHWLETEALLTPQTEITLADKLHEFRAVDPLLTDESFCTIAGWQGNGAIVHYHATPDECARIEGNGVLLLDSGGQYLDGTTDITRTVWVGDPEAIPDTLRHDFTLVLKGHIALSRARFPKGTRGNQLDVLAHQFMWSEGITYGHGTGHGVGHYMGCHEGPANIRTDNNPNPIRLGNVFSDEPGIYRTGEYGIRTENLMVAVPSQPLGPRTTGEQYYEFEVLTLCFYDTRLIDFSMLTDSEKAWLNAYHERVFRETAPFLTEEEKDYLAAKCRPVNH